MATLIFSRFFINSFYLIFRRPASSFFLALILCGQRIIFWFGFEEVLWFWNLFWDKLIIRLFILFFETTLTIYVFLCIVHEDYWVLIEFTVIFLTNQIKSICKSICLLSIMKDKNIIVCLTFSQNTFSKLSTSFICISQDTSFRFEDFLGPY